MPAKIIVGDQEIEELTEETHMYSQEMADSQDKLILRYNGRFVYSFTHFRFCTFGCNKLVVSYVYP